MPILGALLGLFFLSGIPATAWSAGAPAMPAYMVTLTGYNAVPAQTDSDPSMTASGSAANPEVVAARSRNLKEQLPFGTIVAIGGPVAAGQGCGWSAMGERLGYRIIADTMNARYRDSIDVLFNTKDEITMDDGRTKNASTVLGTCPGVAVRIVGYVDITRPSALPKSQAALSALVEKSDIALAK